MTEPNKLTHHGVPDHQPAAGGIAARARAAATPQYLAGLNAEQREAASNLTDIQEHATASSGEPQAGEPGRIVVKRFRVRNASVLLSSEHLSRSEELPLRDIVVDNIGRATGGATYSEAAEGLLMPVLAAARAAAAARLRSVAEEAVSEAVREELEEESEELRKRTDEERLEVSEKVEELLDRP